MSIAESPPYDSRVPVGESLRRWRERRRMTQLELSLQAGVSARHISFIETGRSSPTPAMILKLAGCLSIPLRERNALLLSAGFAPMYSERRLTEPPLTMINDAINRILDAHAPYPAVVVDRLWNLVAANDAIFQLTSGAADSLLEPPVNVLRLTFHPQGLAPRIANLAEWSDHILSRLAHDVENTADAQLEKLLDELRSYPASRARSAPGPPALVVPLRLRTDDGVISLFSMTTVFGTPADVTVSELAIEAFYPEDEFSAAYFRR